MKRRDDDFRVRPGKPKNRQQRFVSQVLREVGKAGGRTPSRSMRRPGARLGRGHVAARFAGRTLSRNSRRVAIKTRLVNLRQVGARSTPMHLRYIEREGVGPNGEPGKAYGPATDDADLDAFEQRGQDDRHQFRFIVSPEDAAELGDLQRYTRLLMQRMEADLGTRLDWVAVDHWNTDNPHTHIVLRGKDDSGKDLIVSRDYIAHGMRDRAGDLATEWLGPRTDQEIRLSLQRQVEQKRWTSLDRNLQHAAQEGRIRLDSLKHEPGQSVLVGRLQYLGRLGLATTEAPGHWHLRSDAEAVLRALGERGDIIRTMQRAMHGMERELAVFEPSAMQSRIIGRVAAKGLAEELYDRGFLVVDGTDGKAHYIALPTNADLAQYPIGGIVEVRDAASQREIDRSIAAQSVEGIYRTQRHSKIQGAADEYAAERVEAYVRRLEALRRAGIVERIASGVWRVPQDLPERGRQYDAQRLGGAAVTLKSHLSIAQQMRVLGATWLDQQLIDRGKGLAGSGFGREAREALDARTDFLVTQGLAERRGKQTVLAGNLLRTLRERNLEAAAERIARETGSTYKPAIEGEKVSGVYRRNILLASGRFAMLDDGMGFSLVPWKPVIERRLGQEISALVRDGIASWDIRGRSSPSIG